MKKHEWKEDQVFVFGSNLLGNHAGGAAEFAAKRCGAKAGIGQGVTEEFKESRTASPYRQWVVRSYALPTCSVPGIALTFEELAAAVKLFIAFANVYRVGGKPAVFFVTRVGCGIAGFTDAQVAPLFWDAPENCILPPEWDEFYL